MNFFEKMGVKTVEKKPLLGYRYFIYGPEGIGKTTLGYEFGLQTTGSKDEVMFLGFEKGQSALFGANVYNPTGWPDTIEFLIGSSKKVDKNGQPDEKGEYKHYGLARYKKEHGELPIKCIIIDTVDIAADMATQYILTKNKVDSINKVNGGYGQGQVQLRKELNRMFGIIDDLELGCIIISHDNVKEKTDLEGNTYSLIQSSLAKGVNETVNKFVDFTAHISKVVEYEEMELSDQTLRTVVKNADKRIIRFRNPKVQTKSRFPNIVDFVNFDENGVDNFVKAIQAAIDAQDGDTKALEKIKKDNEELAKVKLGDGTDKGPVSENADGSDPTMSTMDIVKQFAEEYPDWKVRFFEDLAAADLYSVKEKALKFTEKNRADVITIIGNIKREINGEDGQEIDLDQMSS